MHRQPKVRLTKRETEICSHEFSGRRSNGFDASVQKRLFRMRTLRPHDQSTANGINVWTFPVDDEYQDRQR